MSGVQSAREGLYATIYIDSVLPDSSDTVAMLTGVELNWSQTHRRFYSLGSLLPESVLDGVIQLNGSFKRAYYTNKYLGSLNVGTCRFLGSICPRGTSLPFILGTIVLTGGNLSNMAAENEAATTEEQGFIIYNCTFS